MKLKIYKIKNILDFKSNLAKIIDVNMLASTCTLGSHICKPKMGIFKSLIKQKYKNIRLKVKNLKTVK